MNDPEAVDMWGNPAESPAEREIRFLREYLDRKRWSAVEAKYIIIGIAPEESISIVDGAVTWLPGVSQSWRKMRQRNGGNLWQLRHEINRELNEVAGFISGYSVSPQQWLKLAREACYRPCWLASLSKQESAVLWIERAFPEHTAQSLGGRATRDLSTPYQAKCQIVEKWDHAVKLLGFSRREFQEQMLQEYFKCTPPLAADTSINEWIRHLSQVSQGIAEPRKWLRDIREQNALR